MGPPPLKDPAFRAFMPDPCANPISDVATLDPANMDRIILHLDHIFDTSTGTVDQGFGGIGPTTGDSGMLESITEEHYDR